MQDALRAVSNMLDAEYTLAYYPPKTYRKLRKIEVKVDRHGLGGYWRAAPRSRISLSTELVHMCRDTCTVSPKFHPYAYELHLTSGRSGDVYRDDFADPQQWMADHPDSDYVPGGYELSTLQQQSNDAREEGGLPGALASMPKPSTYLENVIAAYGPPWRDFRVSVSMNATYKRPLQYNMHSQFSSAVHTAAGLVFRINLKGYYALLVSPSEQNKKKLAFELVARTFRSNSYMQSVIVPWTTVDHASPLEAKLMVEDIGDHITLFVDGRQVGTARDDRFDNGYEGFIVSAPAHAVFSNLLVEQR